jgi:hypothetical protein
MPDAEYMYDVDQCDVPKERRPALRLFREKRREWLSWLHTDQHHAIWPTLHTLVWTDVAFSALRGLAEENDESALNNPLIVEALLKGHFATQVLAIRRLMEDTPKERLSLRKLVTDLKRHRALFTRENYVCHDGLPYDYRAVRDALFSRLAAKEENTVFFMSGAAEGPEADGVSEVMHCHFDSLAGVDPVARTREDRLPLRLLTTIETWLDNSGADALAKWSSTYLAHAGGPNERAKLDAMAVTSGEDHRHNQGPCSRGGGHIPVRLRGRPRRSGDAGRAIRSISIHEARQTDHASGWRGRSLRALATTQRRMGPLFGFG